MGTLGDIGVSAAINIIGAFAFLLAFALLRIQPVNDRIYFSKWYMTGKRTNPRRNGNFVGKFVNLNFKTYLTFLNWMPQALQMTEAEIIAHAGLDSAVFLRIYTLGLKIFLPITVVALLILIPVNVSNATLFHLGKEDLVVNDIDKLSISNVQAKSNKFFFHIATEYLFTFWTCLMLFKEYGRVAAMRLKFLAIENRRAEQFTVLVRNIPHVSGQSISTSVENYFRKNHPDHYLCHQVVYDANKFARLIRRRNRIQNWLDYYQLKFDRHPEKKPTTRTGCLGLCGEKVDSIDFYEGQLNAFDRKLTMERQRILKDPKSIMAAAFVSFNSRWGAAVCAQTQQSKNPTLWLTNWAPEPRDIYWRNLSIPFVSLSIRRLVISFLVFALIFFYMIPTAFVQSLANLESLEKVAPFLTPVIELKFVKSFLQGFLPGLALKMFLYFLPFILMIMSKIEGHVAKSVLERKTSQKYYYFMLVNVFLGSVVTGTAFDQLHAFLHQSATQIPRNIGVAIPTTATFFITYIMVDGWAGVAGEILRLKPLVIYHLKNLFIVKTERDRERAMYPGGLDVPQIIPTVQLYFLLGLVYAAVSPILLPFVLVFIAFAGLVFRHQVINVYNQEYESAAAFWPYVHGRFIGSLLISQLLLMGLLSTKKAANSTPLLILLPILTLAFHQYCKHRFEPAFKKYPLEEAMDKDLEGHTAQTDITLKSFLSDAYLHPIFHSFEEVELVEVKVDDESQPTRDPTPPSSALSSPVHQDHEDQKASPVHEDHEEDQEASPVHEDHEDQEASPVHEDHDDEDEDKKTTSQVVNHYEVSLPGNDYHYQADYLHNVQHYEMASDTYHHYQTSNFFDYDNDCPPYGYRY